MNEHIFLSFRHGLRKRGIKHQVPPVKPGGKLLGTFEMNSNATIKSYSNLSQIFALDPLIQSLALIIPLFSGCTLYIFIQPSFVFTFR